MVDLEFGRTLPEGAILRVVSHDGPPLFPSMLEARPAAMMTLDAFLSDDEAEPTQPSRCAALLLETDITASPLQLLDRAASHLRDGGILVCRRLSLGAAAPVHPNTGRSRDEYFAALSSHFGFTRRAAEGLRHDVNVFCKDQPVRWRLATPSADPRGCRELFHRAFGSEISPELWQWKYGDGRGRGVVARRGTGVIAHYGGTARRVAYHGREALALQVCDVMVDPAERAVMTRTGAFFHVASAWLESYFGYRREHLLAFGFPNLRHMRLAAKLGLYAEVERIAELSWTPLEDRLGLTSSVRLLPKAADHCALFATLWDAMRSDLTERIVVIRDPEYLTYRYLAHPQYDYEMIAIEQRMTRRPLALVVLRREADTCRLLDFVGSLREIPRAIAYARRMTGRWGLPRLTGWISSRDAALFQATGAEVAVTDVCVPTNVWSESPPPDEIRNRWWLMMGDTEFL